ncbi:MAG TPA: DUF502 domain-containing protein [bacterium]|nr:DUF502 domain-containing protein [bacterium]
MFKNALRDLRNYFISGLFIVVPIGVTIYMVWGIFNYLDEWLRESRLLDNTLSSFGIPDRFPRYGVGFLTTIFLIIAVGFLGRLYIGKKMLLLLEYLLSHIPVVNWLYNLIKQISYAFFGKNRRVFQQAVLFQYPRKGIYAIAFLVAPEDGQIGRTVGQNLSYVFLATTPNPTSGFLLLVPNKEIIPLDISVEQAVKMVISSGMVASDSSIPLPEKQEEAHQESEKIFS